MAKSTREAYGEALAELGKINERIVVMDADLSGSTKTSTFKKAFPDRFYDFGIAEANMIDAAAGFAFSGYIPFASTFAIFGAGRAYEQIRNSVAYAKANVKLAFTHAGLSVGEDGGSHQALEDISLMRGIPGMTVFVPCDAEEAKKGRRGGRGDRRPRISAPVPPEYRRRDRRGYAVHPRQGQRHPRRQ